MCVERKGPKTPYTNATLTIPILDLPSISILNLNLIAILGLKYCDYAILILTFLLNEFGPYVFLL